MRDRIAFWTCGGLAIAAGIVLVLGVPGRGAEKDTLRDLAGEVTRTAAGEAASLETLYKYLHANPELSLQEEQTAAAHGPARPAEHEVDAAIAVEVAEHRRRLVLVVVELGDDGVALQPVPGEQPGPRAGDDRARRIGPVGAGCRSGCLR